MNPLVSVVIPAFEARRWIGETLDSVLSQSCPSSRLEIVVVDDGSRDATGDVAAGLLETSGIKHLVVRNPSAQGPSAARNAGWRQSSGDWIQFLDADDVIRPDKIEIQARAAATAGADVAAIFSPWARLKLDQEGAWRREAAVTDPAIGNDPLVDVLGDRNFIATGSALFARRWMDVVGGYVEAYRLVEDVDLLMRFVMSGGVLQRVPTDGPLFWYRQHPHSLSRQDDRAFVEACLRNVKTLESHWRTSGGLTPARADFLAGGYFRAARFFAEHDSAAFDVTLSGLLSLRPNFVPQWPTSLRRVSQIVGYRRAEHIAVNYRRLKRALRGSRGADALTQ